MNLPITCITVDDEPRALEVLSILISKVQNLDHLASFSDPFDALDYLKNHLVNVVFLDIDMPELSGFELLKQLSSPPLVVFTTAYSEFALESYEVEAVDYLLKPIEFERFIKSVEKVKDRMISKEADNSALKNSIFVKDGYKQVKVNIDDILYVQSDSNYLYIFTDKEKIMTRMTFSDIVKKLSKAFVRVHNQYLVNINKIDRLENNHIVINETSIPIGLVYRDPFYRIIG